MKKPIDKTYLEDCFKNFHTYLTKNVFHIHDNKTILDKISESESGSMLFNGSEIEDGVTPHIDPETKHWFIGDIDTGIVAEGQKGDQGEQGIPGADAEDVTLESLGAASANHTHGYLHTITLSTTEPETVAEGEIIMVYETGEA